MTDLSRGISIGPDTSASRLVAERVAQVLRPIGALKRLDELAVWLAGWQRTETPGIDSAHVVVFAGDHGVAVEGVSAYPQSVTMSMVGALHGGIATASALSRRVGATLSVIDVGRGVPTANIRTGPALTPPQFESAVEVGRQAVLSLGRVDVLIPGEVGIGNTTCASALAAALYGGDVTKWVGRGTGLDDDGLARKAEVVAEAVRRAGPAEPLELLRQLGGWELAAIAGAVIQARESSIPVLLDGFVTTAAVMPLEVVQPGFLEHCWPAHVSAEPGHRALVERLGRAPILDLEMRLGEASGALVALPILDLAAVAVTDVATFADIGTS